MKTIIKHLSLIFLIGIFYTCVREYPTQTIVTETPKIEIKPKFIELQVGSNYQFNAYVYDKDSTVIDSTNFLWISSDTSIVKINHLGIIIGYNEGTAKIIVSYNKIISDTAEVVVKFPQKYALLGTWKCIQFQSLCSMADYFLYSWGSLANNVKALNIYFVTTQKFAYEIWVSGIDWYSGNKTSGYHFSDRIEYSFTYSGKNLVFYWDFKEGKNVLTILEFINDDNTKFRVKFPYEPGLRQVGFDNGCYYIFEKI